MNRTLLLITTLLLIATYSSGQSLVSRNKSAKLLNTGPGYITINEIAGGQGLGIVDVPFSKYFIGFTTVHGYQINQSFVVAAGTGFSAYNGGNLIPLFLDLRYRILVGSVTPYIAGDGGALFNLAGGGTKYFINPGLGVRYTINSKIGLNISSGLFVQKDNKVRDSFINFKVGITFMPQSKKAHTRPSGIVTGTKPPSTVKTPLKTASVPATTIEKKPTTDPVNVAKPPEKAVQNMNATKPEPETKKIDTLKTKISVPETKKIDSLKNKTSVPETKKIEPAKTPATSTVAKKENVVLRIQFVSNKNPRGSFKITISGKQYDTFEYFYAGAYRSTVGEFSTYTEAAIFQQSVRQSGYPQAFVVVFKNNIRSTDPSLLK